MNSFSNCLQLRFCAHLFAVWKGIGCWSGRWVRVGLLLGCCWVFLGVGVLVFLSVGVCLGVGVLSVVVGFVLSVSVLGVSLLFEFAFCFLLSP